VEIFRKNLLVFFLRAPRVPRLGQNKQLGLPYAVHRLSSIKSRVRQRRRLEPRNEFTERLTRRPLLFNLLLLLTLGFWPIHNRSYINQRLLSQPIEDQLLVSRRNVPLNEVSRNVATIRVKNFRIGVRLHNALRHHKVLLK
jgi:hypothetical protein